MGSLFSSLLSKKEKKYEVFISFRGEDLRKTFVSHLYAAFQREKIKTFIDNINLKRGEDISKTLLKAIKDSQLSVIVFSENFAKSKWCLDEVKQIMKCHKKRKQIVVPIFYHIEPTDVRNQSRTYENAFDEYERQFRYKPSKIRKWKKALEFAAGLAGEHISVNTDSLEATIVEKIAKDVLKRLNDVYVSDLNKKIEKYEAKCQKENHDTTPLLPYRRIYEEKIRKLQMEKEARLSRIRDTRCNANDSILYHNTCY